MRDEEDCDGVAEAKLKYTWSNIVIFLLTKAALNDLSADNFQNK